MARVSWTDWRTATKVKRDLDQHAKSRTDFRDRVHVVVQGEKELGVYFSPKQGSVGSAEAARKFFTQAKSSVGNFEVEYVVRTPLVAYTTFFSDLPAREQCPNVPALVQSRQFDLVTAEAVNCVTPGVGTPLMHAISKRDDDLTSRILGTDGLDVNIQDAEGNTALHKAAYNPYVEEEKNRYKYVRTLLSVGARKDLRNLYGRTPMEMTAIHELRVLLDPATAAAVSLLLLVLARL
jgi:hypothetical protein